MDTDKIEKLSADVFEAEQRYQMLGMRNIGNLDYGEKKKASIEYDLAETAMIEARRALRAEQGL